MGEAILAKMVGQSVYSYSFTTKDMPNSMACKSSKQAKKWFKLTIIYYFKGLQHCLIKVTKGIYSHMNSAFPAALFESLVQPRSTNKTSFAENL